VNRNLFPELFPSDSSEIVEAYNAAFGDAIATHLSVPGVTGDDLAKMSDSEFVEVIKSSDRQPLNPITIARETLGLEEGTPVIEIMNGLQEAYRVLIDEYVDNGVDGKSALRNASNLIGHTEAYITGYSRDLGRLTNKMVLLDPSYNLPTRWLDKIWVPQEDAHDRLWSLMMSGLSDDDMEMFNADHSRHMQIGVHLPITSILPTQTYLMQQEGSTVPSYGNTAALYGPVLRKPAVRIREDEARHRREYQAVTKKLMEVDPDAVVIAIKNEFDNFAMPGKDGIRDFDDKTSSAAINGILDPVSILEVQIPMINQLIENAAVKSEDAKKAKDALLDDNGKYSLRQKAKRVRALEGLREKVVSSAIKKRQLMPAIIGVTVVADKRSGELTFPRSK